MKTVLWSGVEQELWSIDHWVEHISIDQLMQAIDWRQNQIKVYGKWHLEPRLTAWYGPAYSYSSIHWPAQPLPPVLLELMLDLQSLCNFPFNAVLCNLYRNGRDAMGWHADNEPEMDVRCIASLSWGATRTFRLRHKTLDFGLNVELKNGSLLVMENMQNDWQHALPPRLRVSEPRLNLTFRRIL